MSLARNPRQYKGVRAILPPDLQTATRAPTAADKAYIKGTLWLDTDNSTAWMWPGTGDWIALGTGATGGIVTLTGTTGGPISPVAGDIIVTGNATQGASVSGAGHTLTVTVADWTTSQKGVGVLSTNAQAVTGSGTTQAVTPAALTARLQAPGAIGGTTAAAITCTTLTATTGDVVAALGNIEASAGEVLADGDVTTVTGDLVATNGNLVLVTAGNKIEISAGVNGSLGTATLVGGTVTVSTTAVATASKIFTSRNTVGGTPGNLNAPSASIVNATSFVINSSSGTDTSTVNWWIIN